MRNEIIASKRCCVSRPHKQFRLYRLFADSFVEISLSRDQRKCNEGPSGGTPLVCVSRCASRGKIHMSGHLPREGCNALSSLIGAKQPARRWQSIKKPLREERDRNSFRKVEVPILPVSRSTVLLPTGSGYQERLIDFKSLASNSLLSIVC